MAYTEGGRFNFITAQGRHLFKKNTFTVSTLPRARPQPRANRTLLVMKALLSWRREFSLPSLIQFARCGVFGHVLFPRRTGRSSVERWSQDVTDFSRPGVAALRYSHSG